MALTDPLLDTIESTDTFQAWADKCNAVIDALNEKDFITDAADFVNIGGSQGITGSKSFSANVILNGGLSIASSTTTFDSTGGSASISPTKLDILSSNIPAGSVNFIGSNGVQFLSQPGAPPITLKFSASTSSNCLSLNYSGPRATGGGPGGVLEFGDNIVLSLSGNSPILRVSDVDWNLPADAPTSDSFLLWDSPTSTEGPRIVWKNTSEITTEITNDILSDLPGLINDSLGNGLVLSESLLPVGALIDVDLTAVIGWINGTPYNIINTEFPNWLVCDGKKISLNQGVSDHYYVPDSEDLIKILNTTSGADTATLPEYWVDSYEPSQDSPGRMVKLIKYKQEPIKNFSILKGPGINFISSENIPKGSFGISDVATTISLNFSPSDFKTNSTTGALELSSQVSDSALASTLAKRTTGGQLVAAAPSAPQHLTPKSYVDDKFTEATQNIGALSSSTDDTISLHESMDGDSGYVRSDLLYRIDQFGRAYVGDEPKMAVSPLYDNKFARFKKVVGSWWIGVGTAMVEYFIDEDDILYTTGRNDYGAIGQQGRSAAYLKLLTGKIDPYNDASTDFLIPGVLPSQNAWPASAVPVEKIINAQDAAQGAGGVYLTIKTKDGLGNSYVSSSPSSGFVKYMTGAGADLQNQNVPYTRGYYISVEGASPEGALGNGTSNTTSKATGPLVWGSGNSSPGRTLWRNFGLLGTERSTSLKPSEPVLNKRFHWFKPNAVLAGGLAQTEAAALAAWRTETGLSDASFSDYSWYIKKVVRSWDSQYVIVGKPGNESENELWATGRNVSGNLGLGEDQNKKDELDFFPAISPEVINLNPLDYVRVLAGTQQSPSDCYSKKDSSNNYIAHGFRDFERITVSGDQYVILRGDKDNLNLDTRFRLFPVGGLYHRTQMTAIVNAFYNPASAGQTFPLTNTAILHHKILKGIVDISLNWYNSSDSVVALVTTDSTTDSSRLDSLPVGSLSETQLYGWGNNSNGQSGRSSSVTNSALPSITTPPGALGSGERFVQIKTVSGLALTSFALTNHGNLFITGHGQDGMIDSGAITSTDQKGWRKANLCASESFVVEKFFVVGSPGRSNDDAGLISDSRERGSLFVVAKKPGDTDDAVRYLFSAGENYQGRLGTPRSLNLPTPNLIRIPFPENPANIVQISGSFTKTRILCKTPGKESGRVYESGGGTAGFKRIRF